MPMRRRARSTSQAGTTIRAGRTRERGAIRAAYALVLLVWLGGVVDRGALEPPPPGAGVSGVGPGGASSEALAPLTVDLWRDPPWRLRLIPGIGAKRAAELVAAREAAAEADWRTFRDLADARGLSAGTLRALWAARAKARTPGHVPAVRIRLSGERPSAP